MVFLPDEALLDRLAPGRHARSWPIRAVAVVRPHLVTIAITAVCAGALLWQAREYMPFFVDDSFIAIRYVARLLHGHGLTWTDGEHVEGYSDLLWVLVVAAGGLFSKDLVAVSRALGVLSTVLAVVAIGHACRPRRLVDGAAPLAGGLAMVLTSPVVAWSIGGLEQPLLAALVAWAVVLAYPLAEGVRDHREGSRRLGSRATWVGVLLGLVCLTRPDGGIFAATTCAAVLVANRLDARSRRLVGRIAAIAALLAVAQLVFRRLYYEEWLPNTAHVKLALTRERVSQGWQYVSGSEPYLRALLLLALAAVVVAATERDARRRVLVPLTGAVVWTAYVIVIGGDISPARRHLVVTIVLLALIVTEGLRALARRAFPVKVVAWALTAGALATLARAQDDDPERKHAQDDTWVWSGRDVGGLLSHAFAAERPLIAVDAAGSLPYYASELPCLDMLGLNDRVLATLHPADFGTGFVGHELGNGAYILGRKPDLVVFHNSLGDENPAWRGGREMIADPEFSLLYQLVTFDAGQGVRARMWLRKEDGRLGIQRSERRVVVPAYLLRPGEGGVAELDPTGRMALRIDGDHAAGLRDVHVGVGRWQLVVEASGRVATVVYGPRGKTEGPGDVPLDLGPCEPWEPRLVIIQAVEQRAYVRKLVFERLD